MPFKCLWFCSVLGWVSQGSCPSLISFPTAGCCDESGGPWTLCLCFSYLSIYLSICGPSVCRSCSVIPHIFYGRNCFICLCWFRVSVGEDRFRGFLWCNLRPAFEANFFFFKYSIKFTYQFAMRDYLPKKNTQTSRPHCSIYLSSP